MRGNFRDTWAKPIYKPLPTTMGVYILWFEGGSSVYIGGAKNIQRRVQSHLGDMGRFKNHKMRSDLDRLGAENLHAAVLCQVEHCTELPEAEGYWMARYRERGWRLYNAEAWSKSHREWKVKL